VFCEVSKYARVAHPEIEGVSGRTRIKQKYSPQPNPAPQWYPPKWSINGRVPQPTKVSAQAPTTKPPSRQRSLFAL
jgi:hypothetical protein